MTSISRRTLLALLAASTTAFLAGCLHPIRAARALVSAPAPAAPQRPG